MRRLGPGALALALFLCGCSVSTRSPLATAITVGVVAADGFRYYQIGPDGSRIPVPAPDPDPTRRVNVQDCTHPVDPGAGNLLCR